MAKRSDRIIRLIGVFKLIKAVGLTAFAIAALSLDDRDLEHGVRGWIDDLQPSNRWLRLLIEKISSIDPHTLRLLGIGTLFYAALFAVEGVGLLRRKLWAEYMTTIITISFIPIEIYELVEKGSVVKALVIAVNIAIVIYLVLRFRAERHWPFRTKLA